MSASRGAKTEPDEPRPRSPGGGEAAEAARLRVLAVDDEPGMRRAIARSLAPRYQVEQAASAREALELAGREHFDIAVVDVRMPEVDGFELLEALKIESPETEVIMITGSRSDLSGKLVRAIGERAFYFLEKPFDRPVLAALVDRAAELTQLARQNRAYLGQLREEARRLEADLETARRFQLSLLPQGSPRHPAVDVFAFYAPHQRVGGDFYDFLPQETGALSIALADVAGHGVSAALLTGMFKVHLEAVAAGGRPPHEVLREIHHRWGPVSQGRFATVFFGTVAPDGATLSYASGGHPPAVLLRRGREDLLLGATGLPVGAFPDQTYEEKKVSLEVGDAVVLYTDGLTEAENPAGEPMPWEQLRREIGRLRDLEAREIVAELRGILVEWVSPGEPGDDVSLIALRRVR